MSHVHMHLQAGIERAVEIMRSGSMFRFDNPEGVEDEVCNAKNSPTKSA